MSQVPETPRYHDDEIDLRELFAVLWRGKWVVIAVSFVFAVAGVAYALYLPNVYQSSVLLTPAQDESKVSGISGQLGSLASLAGISLGGGGSNQIVIAKQVLQSRAFLASFIRRHNIAIPLIAATGWNEESGNWVYDREIYNPDTGEWGSENGESLEPTDWDLVEAFKEDHLRVSEDPETGMVTVSVKSYSPFAAQQWAEWLVRDVNEHMRKEDVIEAEARIAYLEEKLRETNIAGMQQVFYQLIESETRTVMLANAQKEYVFKTVDPAVVPEEKNEPKRAVICVLATLTGGILGILVVFVGATFKGGKKEKVNTSAG